MIYIYIYIYIPNYSHGKSFQEFKYKDSVQIHISFVHRSYKGPRANDFDKGNTSQRFFLCAMLLKGDFQSDFTYAVRLLKIFQFSRKDTIKLYNYSFILRKLAREKKWFMKLIRNYWNCTGLKIRLYHSSFAQS